MQRVLSSARLFLLASLALAAVSCGASTSSRESSSAQSDEDAAIEDSGKKLSGEFELSSLEDSYRMGVQSQTTFTFDEMGNFKRQDRARLEEGSYLITTQSELVLYIEIVNAEARTSAKVERYRLADQTENGFTLEEGPSMKLVLRKR